jgi:farnesyl-diphosphate farnesyltransferase
MDITKRMGEGMAIYAGRTDLPSDEYDEYCYYVAGMVGEGLT